MTTINAQKAPFAIAIALFMALASSAQAQQDVDISAEFVPKIAGPGETVEYRVQVSVDGNYDINLLRPPGFGSLHVVGTTSEPSFYIRGAQATRSLRLTYRIIAPQEPGEFPITSPKIIVGSRTLTPTSPPLRVSNTAATTRRGSSTDQERKERADQPAFIELVLSTDRDPYPGEQLQLRYELWIRQSQFGLHGSGFSDPPLDDFWVEELTDNPRQRRRNQRRYGTIWEVIPLRSLAIFPLRPGPAIIDGIDLPLTQRAVFGRQTELVARSTPLEIDVLPLPPDAPDGFSEGNVGRWQLSAELDSTSARVGGQIVLTAHVHGTGLPGQLGWPILEQNDDFRLLATEDSTQKHHTPMGVEGTRTFQFRLMPLKEGPLTTPPLTFSYFDPDKAEYITLNSKQLHIQVEPGELPALHEAQEERATPAPTRTIDLHDPLPAGALADTTEPARPPIWLFIPPIIALLLLLLEALLGPSIRAKRAPGQRRRRLLQRAERALDEAGSPPDPDVLLKTLNMVLSKALGVQIGALSTKELRHALQPLHLPKELREQTLTLVDELIKRRYAPTAQNSADTLERTRALIKELINWQFATAERPAASAMTTTAVLILTSTLMIALSAHPTAHAQTNPLSPDELIEQAQQAALDEDWESAAKTWRELAQTQDDPTFDFNAGTAFAYAGHLGHARWHLERAIANGAHTHEVRKNLDQVINEVKRRSPAHAAFTPQKLNALGLHLLAPWLTALALWLAIAIALLRRFSPLLKKTTLFYPLLATALLLAILSAALSFYLHHFDQNARIGVVLTDQPPLRDAPSHHAAAQKNGAGLSSGAVFRLRQHRDGWSQVELPSGLTGWLPDDDLGLIQESEL